MKDIQSYFKQGEIVGRLANDYGESIFLGSPWTYTHFMYKHLFRWKVDNVKNEHPYTRITLYSKNIPIDTVYIKALNPKKTVELEYS